jgi:hypothetical protein
MIKEVLRRHGDHDSGKSAPSDAGEAGLKQIVFPQVLPFFTQKIAELQAE